MIKRQPQKIEIENVTSPGRIVRVDAAKYEAMKRAYLHILPATSPGFTAAEVREGVLPLLPQNLFPQGATVGWWIKGVQLDLEAKGIVAREPNKPLRWYKC